MYEENQMEGDFDIGIILYVVITLVAVLMGVLGKKKKPAAAGKSSGKQTGDDFLRNLERAFNMGREEEEEVFVEPERETGTRESLTDMRERAARMKKERKEEAESRTSGLWEEHERLHRAERDGRAAVSGGIEAYSEDEIRRSIEGDAAFGIEGVPVFSGVQEPADQLQVIELGEFEGSDYFDIVRDFDATTAVIYSAVINRTEY
ncbi:MAG TPA: hypothetical protein ENO05_04090 [Bacteroides sp.]|nr:hypothetical protein [Bacteroides sp.]